LYVHISNLRDADIIKIISYFCELLWLATKPLIGIDAFLIPLIGSSYNLFVYF